MGIMGASENREGSPSPNRGGIKAGQGTTKGIDYRAGEGGKRGISPKKSMEEWHRVRFQGRGKGKTGGGGPTLGK